MNNRQISAKLKADMKKAGAPFDWSSRVLSPEVVAVFPGHGRYGDPDKVLKALEALGYSVVKNRLFGWHLNHPGFAEEK
jgi:hypothetical protein